MPKASARTPTYLLAELQEIQLFSERSQLFDSQIRPAGTRLEVKAETQSKIGLGLFDSPAGERMLAVNHAYVVLLNTGDAEGTLCNYESEYRAIFSVSEAVGIDPGKPIPLELAATYIKQVAWVARTRAQGTLAQMRLSGFDLPKPAEYKSEALASTEAVSAEKQALKRAKRAARSASHG